MTAPAGRVATNCNVYIMASVKIYPRAILSTPGTSGYRLSYKMVRRAVPHKPPRSGIFFKTEVVKIANPAPTPAPWPVGRPTALVPVGTLLYGERGY